MEWIALLTGVFVMLLDLVLSYSIDQVHSKVSAVSGHDNGTDALEADVSTKLFCRDFRQRIVFEGDLFIPHGDDPCTQCHCVVGQPQMCVASVCSLPQDCRNVRRLMTDHCCKFICFDRKWRTLPRNYSGGVYAGPYNGLTGDSGDDDTDGAYFEHEGNTPNSSFSNYSLRFGFFTMSGLLILVCLMFSIHRLRKRRLRALLARHSTINSRTFGGDSYDEVDSSGLRHLHSSDYDSAGNTFARSQPPPPPYKQSPSIDLPPAYEDVVRVVPDCVSPAGVAGVNPVTSVSVRNGAERVVQLTPEQLKALLSTPPPPPASV